MFLSEVKRLHIDFKKIIKAFLKKILFLITVYMIISFLSVYPNRLLGNIIDLITVEKGLTSSVLKLIFVYILIRFSNLIFSFFSTYYGESIRVNLEKNLRIKSINKLLDIKYLNESNNLQTSEYVTRIYNAIKELVESILEIVYWFGKSLFVLIFTFYFIFKINYIIAFLIIPFVLVMALLTKYISKKQKDASKKEIESNAKLIDFTHEIINSLSTIKIFNSEKYILNNYNKTEENWGQNRLKCNLISSTSVMSLSLFGIIIISLILLLSGSGKSMVKPGEITSLILYTGNIFVIIMEVFNNVIIFSALENSLKRFNDIFNEKNIKIEEKGRIAKTDIANWDIEFKSVNFRYQSKKIINNMSFYIPEGSKVAIVGKNGTGKSTLLKLISGLYKPDSGEIYVGNILLNNIDEKVLRDNLSYVLQESYIYSDTVSNNIFLGNYDNEDKLNYVTDICQLNDLVKDLPEGYIIHNNGANLSGGQKQKIGLARSIIRQPQILLLDEYTNALDNESQKIISDEIYNRHRTIIFVTHNFEILNKADLVIYLGKNGNYYINSHYKLLSECEDYNNYIKIN